MKKYLFKHKRGLIPCVFLMAACSGVHASEAIQPVVEKQEDNIKKNTEIKNEIRSRTGLFTEHAESEIQNSCSVTFESKEILKLSNRSREKSRKCNGKRIRRAAKLRLDCSLSKMAKKHALELHERAVLSHQSADGSSLTDRANKLGIQWRALAENIADGYQDPVAVHNSWLTSGPHCKNIMNSTYNSIGVAEHEGVWVVVFAKK